jgi:phosphoadenosine phosphosulfate reductase
VNLEGKRLLITGVLTRRSIAFAVAREAQLAGAEVLLTGFGRSRRMTERAAARLPEAPEAKAAELEDASAQEALAWALETFHPRMYIACSFQKTSSVTVHMAHSIDPEARFFYLDTDVLFPETYETRDRLEERYGINFHRYSSITLEQQAGLYGDQLWSRDPDSCCGIRKVEPMRSALAAVDLWVSGIRRSDSQTRARAPKFAWDKRFGLWKLNPLADWSEKQVWSYLHEHDIPYNPLHDQGYPSIGCTHCTRKPAAGEDARAGRWAGMDKTECGLHG